MCQRPCVQKLKIESGIFSSECSPEECRASSMTGRPRTRRRATGRRPRPASRSSSSATSLGLSSSSARWANSRASTGPALQRRRPRRCRFARNIKIAVNKLFYWEQSGLIRLSKFPAMLVLSTRKLSTNQHA